MSTEKPQPPIERCDTWIVDGTVLTMDEAGTVHSDGAVGIRQGRVAYVGPKPAELARVKGDAGFEIVSAANCLVLPGLINGHTHLGMTLFRGICDDQPLDIWLREWMFPLERRWCSPESVYQATLHAGVELIRGGTTLVNDMYYFEIDTVRALHELGIRCLAGKTLIEISGIEPYPKNLRTEFDAFLEATAEYPLAIPVIAPHSVYGLGEKLWPEILEYRADRDLRLHVHASESRDEVENCRKQYGCSPIEIFERWGMFEAQTTLAHAVELSDADIEILGKHGAGVVHNPESNLKLGNGIARVPALRAAGVAVGLGTDSVVSNNDLDLFAEGSIAAKLQSHRVGPGALNAETVVRMWTTEGAQALGVDHFTGSLEVGKSADLITVQLGRAHSLPVYNPYSFLVYAAKSDDVRDMWVQGKPVMRDRKILRADEAAIFAASTEWAVRIASNTKN